MLDIKGNSVCIVAYINDPLLFGIKNSILIAKERLTLYTKYPTRANDAISLASTLRHVKMD